ncbi:MAG: response regulator [Hydrococcus sp. RM1_1_31]|nr:response regulator [Hydrococcus sp. RM1_1_31]
MTHHILVLEDEFYQRQALEKAYRKEIKSGEYKLIFAETGEEALEAIENDKEREIDFIISDLKLPAAKIEGWDFIRILAERNINIKTIVITAVGDLEDFTEQERKNIIFFFKKNQEEVSEKTLKTLLEQAFRFPDNINISSYDVRYNTVRKIIKDLTPKQKVQIIRETVSYLEIKELKQVKNNFLIGLNAPSKKHLKKIVLDNGCLKKKKQANLSSWIKRVLLLLLKT